MVHEVEHHLHVRGRRVDPDPDAVDGGEVVGEEVQHELVHTELAVVALDDGQARFAIHSIRVRFLTDF